MIKKIILATFLFPLFFIEQFSLGDEKTLKKHDIANVQTDGVLKSFVESDLSTFSIIGSRCIKVKNKKYIISTYGIKYDPNKNGEKLNAEKIAILKAKAQIVAFVHGSKIINVTSYDVDVTAKTDKGTIKAQGSIEVNESFKETIEGTLKGAFTVAKWTNRLEDTVYVALGVEVP